MSASRATWAGAAALLAVLLTIGFGGRPAVNTASAQDAGETEPVVLEIEDYMSQINRSMRRVKRQLEDPARIAETLAQLGTAQSAVIKAKELVPHRGEQLPDGERAEFVRQFRLTMVELASEMLKLETALLEGNTAGAVKSFDTIKSIQKRGHNQFQEEDEDH